MSDVSSPGGPSILIVGASRGLGYAMAAEFAGRGWTVVGTVRGGGSDLAGLAAQKPGQVAVEILDVTEPDQIAALRERLAERRFGIVFVNAGTADSAPGQTLAEVATEDFVRVMLTNVLGVMRAVEGLGDLVTPDGVVGAMSSGQGSLANNTGGGSVVYRGSKAALNQSMRSYAARHADRAMVLLAPGWIRTAMGGPDAPFTVEEAMPKIVDVLIAQQGTPGLRYLDRFGQAVPW
jgi:NAD(P)-dependent dehydrogenase (short-subunit alcohol dehydrogenase family)